MIPRISHFFPMISPFFQSPTVAGSPRALVSQDPGRNLADKLLNEPGQPPRCCVVLRIAGEEGGKMGGFLIKSTKNAVSSKILIYVQNPKSQNESGDFNILASRPGGLSGKDGEAEENGEENIKSTAISPTNKCRIRITENLTKPRFDRFFSITVFLSSCPAGIQHARGRLLDALRQRGKAGRRDSKLRLGEAGESVMKWVYSTVYSIHVALW